MLEKVLLDEEVNWAITTESMILKKVLSRLPVIRHHRIRLRFIESHSSDYHSIGASLRHLRSLFVGQLGFDLNDLSRTICL